jgi:ATP-binding cassette subfamily F protein 3
MANLQLSGVSLAFGARVILKNVTIHLGEGNRAALCGINGSGKSTLLKVIAREIEPDSGERSLSKGSSLAYLPQSIAVLGDRTLLEEAQSVYPASADDREEGLGAASGTYVFGEGIEGAAEDGTTPIKTVGSGWGTGVPVNALRNTTKAAANGDWSRDKDINIVLMGLGFTAADFTRRINEFSSGWKMRIALAKTLLQKADFLLLDEPTNYLDIEARQWLLKFLSAFKGGFLLVSNDRFFLDNVINEVYDLFQGSLKRYTGNYSAYEKRRKAELDELLKRHSEQEAEIKKSEDLIRRFRYKASKAAMVQERIKKLEKMGRIEIPENLKKITIAFPLPPHSGKIALTATGIGKCYGEKTVLESLDLQLDSGERLVVAGKNGAGKSTLLRILGGRESDYAGEIRYGTGIAAGYFSVESAESLTGDKTVLQFMEQDAPLPLLPKIRDMLGAFLFRGDDVYKALGVLSGGEKSRLALLKMLSRPLNLLILDEPTNHLDIWTKDILLDALTAFTGTIVFVCHDRAFMESLSTKTLYLDGGKHALYYGGYAWFMENREMPEAPGTATLGGQLTPSGHTPTPYRAPAQRSGSREEAKKLKTEEKRRKKREEELIAKIEALEAAKSQTEAALSRPDVYSSGEKAKKAYTEIRALEAAIEAAHAEWEGL